MAIKRIKGMIVLDEAKKEQSRPRHHRPQSPPPDRGGGSGTEPHEVKQFLFQFDQARTLMRQMASMSIFDRLKMVTGMGKAGMFNPGSMMPKQKIGTGHRKTPKERAEERKKKKKKR